MRYKKSKKKEPAAPPKSFRIADAYSSGLRHTKLERRRLLNADFGFDGTNFLIDNFVDSDAGDNNILVGQDATNYIFTLADGDWVGSDIGTDVVGSGTDTLLVDKSIAGLVRFILESDTAVQFDIQFDNFDFGGEFSISLDGGVSFGTVSQTAGTAISNAGLFDISGALNIELNNSGNDFSTIGIVNADDVLVQDTNSVILAGLVTNNGDAKLTVGTDLAINGQVDLGIGSLLLDVGGNVTQTDEILAGSLGLMVDGTTTLQNMSNHVSTLAVSNDGLTLYTDDDDVQIGSVTVAGMTVTGISNTDDVKLDIDGFLQINEAIDVGTADLFLRIRGDLTQTASITGHGLGLMVGEMTDLQDGGNNFEILALANDGLTLYADADSVVLGEITVDGMTVTGAVTSNDDVKLTIGMDLGIDEVVTLGDGNLFLAVAGNVTQTQEILASSLGLMVDGTTTLQDMSNHVFTLAAANMGLTLYTDDDDVQIGSVTVGGMTVTGITTSNNDLKLDIDGFLQINEAIDVGTGNAFLRIRGDLTQTASITADGLGLMVGELTELQNPNNNVDVLALSNDGLTLYTDFDSVVVGEVTVDGMTVTGAVTSDDDVKLTIGNDLAIDEAVALGNGSLFLTVAGNVTQSASISGSGLGLMVDGTTTLQNPDNDFLVVAASNNGTTLYTNTNDLEVSEVTVAGMTVTGITTSDDDVKLAGQNIAISEAIALGDGDLFLNGMTVSQTAEITAHGLALMVSSAILQNPTNNVTVLAASISGTLLYTDLDGLEVNTVSVDGMAITGIDGEKGDVKLTIGGGLAINAVVDVGSGNLLLDVSGDVTQTAAISGNGLGLMVTGTTTLQNPANNFVIIAAENQNQTLFTDADDLTIGTVKVNGMTVTGIVTSDNDARLTVGGDLFVDRFIDVGAGNLLLEVGGNVTQNETITADGLALFVGGTTTLQNTFNTIDVFSAFADGQVLFANSQLLTVDVVVVDGVAISGVTTIGDNVKLDVAGDIVIDTSVSLGTGDLLLASTGNVTQTASIQSNGLGLMVAGSTTLQDPANDVNVIAADNGGVTLFTGFDDLTVGSVTVDGMLVTGIATANADAKLNAGGDLAVDAAIGLGLGDLFLASTGNVTQTASIQSDGLGLMVSGLTALQDATNDVNVISAANGGVTLFTNTDNLTVGSVLVDGMLATGITTVDANVKLVSGGDLIIDEAIAVGSGDLFLSVTGNVTQTASIQADGLGLMVTGSTALQNAANDVNILAADNGGITLFTDVDDLTIGAVTVDGMLVSGLTTANASVKLSVGAEFAIDELISIGSADLFIQAAGNVTQAGAISAGGLGLMVQGMTTLQNAANDVDTFAADNQGITLFNDVDDLVIGTISVNTMSVSGIQTTDDNAKLNIGGDLSIEDAIDLINGDLFLSVSGDVTQTASIQSNGLGLMVSGSTTLQNPANDVNVIAAANGGVTLFTGFDDLTVGSVTVDGMLVTGITTVDADVKLMTGGDLAVNAAVNLGLGNLFLASTGNVTQTASIQSDALGLMVIGSTTLQDPTNDVNMIAAANGDATLFTDVDDLTVGSVLVDGMLVTGITTVDADVKLMTGGDLAVNAAVNLGLGDLFLASAGSVTQTASIQSDGLGLMVIGSTTLQDPTNDVNMIAAANGDATLFTDVDDLTVGSILVDGMLVSGITTVDADAKLMTGENLAVNAAVNLGLGDLFLASTGSVTQTASIQSDGLGLMVTGSTTLQDPINDVNVIAAANGGTTFFADADGLTVGSVTVDGMLVIGIATIDADAKLMTGEDLALDAVVSLGMGDLFLAVTGNVTQTAAVSAAGLGLMVSGSTTLQDPVNDVDVIAANDVGVTLFTDVDDLIVGSVLVDGMLATGITTVDANVKLVSSGDLIIGEAIAVGSGDLFLSVTGNVTQTESIQADGLGLLVTGSTTLQDTNNDVSVIAAENGGITLFNDRDDLVVATVTVDGMTVTGVVTSDADVKLSADDNLTIEKAISIGGGSLFLDVGGNVTQVESIAANALALMVDGTTTLQNGTNDVNQLAAANGGTVWFTDSNDFNVGSVAVDGMTVKGIVISGDFVVIANGDISQSMDAPVIVSGLTDITTTGDICWTFGDCFGLESELPDGLNDNDFNLLQIAAAANAEVVDGNEMTVSLALVTGQLRLAAGDATSGSLLLNGNISSGDQILLQASAGVTQTGGILSTDQLLIGGNVAKESTGDFILQSDNVINEVAAQVIGDLRLTNMGNLNIGVLNYSSACGTQQPLSGLDIAGNLVLVIDAALVAETGHLTQSVGAPVLVAGTADLNATGNIILLGDDRDPADGGNGNDFQGVVNLNDNPALDGMNRDYVEIADVNRLIVEDANANVGIHLFAGTTTAASLDLIGEVTAANVLLQSSGGVDQDATNGVVTASSLIVGGDQIVEGGGAFILRGQNQVDQLVGDLQNGSLQLQNLNALTVSSGLSFIGSDGLQTDEATGLIVGGNGSTLTFADPNLALANTAQGIVGNNNGQFNPAFEQYLDVNDIGVAILNENLLTIETGALVNAANSDIYLETVGNNDLNIEDTVRVDNVNNRILVVAGGELQLEPNGRLERGSAGLVTTLLNDITLQDPTGSPADQNRLVDLNSLTQTLQFIFGDAQESNFDASIFWGIVGQDDNSLTFASLDPTQLSALESVLFGAGVAEGFESRSFYSTVNLGNTSETVQSQPIGNPFDNSGTISDVQFVPSSSFTLDFLRNNPEFRSVVFVFNDANINLFQNASSGAIEDLNVATADFEGLARFAEPARITITRQEQDVPTQFEVVPQPVVQIFETSFRTEEPLFVQPVPEKFYIVVFFDSQFEADQFEFEFGDEEREFEEVLELLKELGLEKEFLEWRTSGGESDSLDANKIREIISRADLDLEENENWVERFEGWLRAKTDANDEVPDVPRGVYKILEVDNGKIIIQGDDIDRKFVPEPQQGNDSFVEPDSDGESTESKTQTLPVPERDGLSTGNGSEFLDRFESGCGSRLARWNAMMHGEGVLALGDGHGIAGTDSSSGGLLDPAGIDSGETGLGESNLNENGGAAGPAFRSSAASLIGLLAVLSRRSTPRTANQPRSIGESRGSSLIAEKSASLDRNMFSSSARFRRRSNRDV